MAKRPTKPTTLNQADMPAKLDRFIAEHPSEGDSEAFDAMLGRMTGTAPASPDAPKKGKE